MPECEHEWEPFPTEMPVGYLSELGPFGLDKLTPPSIVPCKKCGAPINRGRYHGYISVPDLPNPYGFFGEEDESPPRADDVGEEF